MYEDFISGDAMRDEKPEISRPTVGDTCEFKGCTRKIVDQTWSSRPLVILLQRCCQECYDEQSEILWEIGS